MLAGGREDPGLNEGRQTEGEIPPGGNEFVVPRGRDACGTAELKPTSQGGRATQPLLPMLRCEMGVEPPHVAAAGCVGLRALAARPGAPRDEHCDVGTAQVTQEHPPGQQSRAGVWAGAVQSREASAALCRRCLGLAARRTCSTCKQKARLGGDAASSQVPGQVPEAGQPCPGSAALLQHRPRRLHARVWGSRCLGLPCSPTLGRGQGVSQRQGPQEAWGGDGERGGELEAEDGGLGMWVVMDGPGVPDLLLPLREAVLAPEPAPRSQSLSL